MEEAFGRRKACFADLNKERVYKTRIFGRDTVSLRKKRIMRRSCGRNSFLLLLLRRGKKEKGEGASGRSARNCQNEDDRDEQRSLSGALDRARRQKENTIRILFEWSDKQYIV